MIISQQFPSSRLWAANVELKSYQIFKANVESFEIVNSATIFRIEIFKRESLAYKYDVRRGFHQITLVRFKALYRKLGEVAIIKVISPSPHFLRHHEVVM
jgi:hypothetical protein